MYNGISPFIYGKVDLFYMIRMNKRYVSLKESLF